MFKYKYKNLNLKYKYEYKYFKTLLESTPQVLHLCLIVIKGTVRPSQRYAVYWMAFYLTRWDE